MTGWEISTIVMTLVAIALTVRLMIEDERNRKLELRIDLLTRARSQWQTSEYKDECHVLPVNDLRDHWEHAQCWCKPSVEPGEGAAVVIIHNSADGREVMENDGLFH